MNQLLTTIQKSSPIVIATSGKWQARQLELNWPKLLFLWKKLREHKTIFSDFNRDNFPNFLAFVSRPNSIWLELVDGSEIVGLLCFEGLESVIETEGHLVMFDRQPAEKLGLVKQSVIWMFENFPINRMTVKTPVIYYGTIRLLKKLGFTLEGTLREAAFIGNKWLDVTVYGILRREI